MDFFNLASLFTCFLCLSYFLCMTRRADNLRFWGLRFCVVVALVCVSYLSYEAWADYGRLPTALMFLHLGYLALSFTVVLIWQLLKKEKSKEKTAFAERLTQLLQERLP
ncbi:MAG: hypothetical protein Q4B88_03390 [Moraxella sp.]|nr:hypothetical protein [Moraxella sp.]